MSKISGLILKFKSKPTDFSYSELQTVLSNFSYKEVKGRKSSGPRVAWVNSNSKHIVRLHKPHPSPILKRYQIDLILEELKTEGYI